MNEILEKNFGRQEILNYRPSILEVSALPTEPQLKFFFMEKIIGN